MFDVILYMLHTVPCKNCIYPAFKNSKSPNKKGENNVHNIYDTSISNIHILLKIKKKQHSDSWQDFSSKVLTRHVTVKSFRLSNLTHISMRTNNCLYALLTGHRVLILYSFNNKMKKNYVCYFVLIISLFAHLLVNRWP